MKLSKKTNRIKLVFEFDTLKAAQNFYEKATEEIHEALYAEDLPKGFAIKIRIDGCKVKVSANRQLCKLLMEDYDD